MIANAKNAKVAVITTCFNQATFLGAAIESVLEQTVPVLLHIVVDDGSTDQTPQLLAQFRSFPYLRAVTVTQRGMAAARNAGLLNVPQQAEWVIPLDADDRLAPDYVERCLDEADTHNLDVVISARRDLTEHGLGPAQLPDLLDPSLDEWLERCQGYSCAMFKHEVFLETGGYHHGAGMDCDWDLWIDVKRRGYRIGYAPDAYYIYRRHPGSYTNQLQTLVVRTQNLAEMRRHFPELQWNPHRAA